MLVVVQYPFLDARGLLGGGATVLGRPGWGDEPQPGDFMRGFGRYRARNVADLADVGTDHAYADAHGAIRFPNNVYYDPGRDERRHLLYVWFRRLYYDGRMSGRVQIGFVTDPLYRRARAGAGVAYDVAALWTSLSRSGCVVRDPTGGTSAQASPLTRPVFSARPLLRASTALQRLYEWATTAGATAEPWRPAAAGLVVFGEPRLLVAADLGDRLSGVGACEPGLTVAPARVAAEGGAPTVWVQATALGAPDDPAGQEARQDRVALSRFLDEVWTVRSLGALLRAHPIRSKASQDEVLARLGALRRKSVNPAPEGLSEQTIRAVALAFAGDAGLRTRVASALDQSAALVDQAASGVRTRSDLFSMAREFATGLLARIDVVLPNVKIGIGTA